MSKITLKENEIVSGLIWINSNGLQSMDEKSINAEDARWAYSIRRGVRPALVSKDPEIALFDDREDAIHHLMNHLGAGHYIIGGTIVEKVETSDGEEEAKDSDVPVDGAEEAKDLDASPAEEVPVDGQLDVNGEEKAKEVSSLKPESEV